MKRTAKQALDLMAQTLFDKKGFNILALDVRGISTMTDYLLIAEGNIDRHVQSLAKTIIETFEENGEKPFHFEGLSDGGWAVLDYGDIMVHLFVPDLREKYALEELWREAKIVDVKIDVEKVEKVRKRSVKG